MTVLAALAASTTAVAGGSGRIISAHGVRVVVPAGWRQVHESNPSSVTDPVTLLVVGTAGVRPRRSGCLLAGYHVPAGGAVVVIVGWKHLALSGAARQRPGRWPLEKLVSVHRPSFECFAGRGAAADVVLRGRAFQINVLVGDGASRRRVAAALAVGRSFALTR